MKKLLILLLILILPLSALAESYTAWTVSDHTPVYNASGKQLGTLPADTELTVTAVKNGICRVTRDGATAYVYASALRQGTEDADGIIHIDPTTFYVAKNNAKVYDARGKVLGKLPLNTKLTVTAYNADLALVSSGKHQGLMRRSDLSDSKVQPPAKNGIHEIDPTVFYVANDSAPVYDSKGKALGSLPLNTEVTVTAYNDTLALITFGKKTGLMYKTDLSAERVARPRPAMSTCDPAVGTAREMDWWNSGIQNIFARGTIATVTDVETGISWKVYRSGGTNHADVQPLTAADTAAMKYVYGGKWSWDRRAIFVTINGVNYAASMNGMPHGSGSIKDNNFNGHHCIHFTNSRTHGTNRVNADHQNAIRTAALASM